MDLSHINLRVTLICALIDQGICEDGTFYCLVKFVLIKFVLRGNSGVSINEDRVVHTVTHIEYIFGIQHEF